MANINGLDNSPLYWALGKANGEYYMNIHHKMHHYLDHDMPDRDKMIITWIKHNLKQSKDSYSTFKALYYEYALAKAGVDKLLYQLH